MSKGDAAAVFEAEPLTPKFFDTNPVLEDPRPLTPGEQEQLDKLLTETPEYQKIMQSCIELKALAAKIGESIVEGITEIKNREGGIQSVTPEEVELLSEMQNMMSETVNDIKGIAQQLEDSDLPIGECNTAAPATSLPGPAN